MLTVGFAIIGVDCTKMNIIYAKKVRFDSAIPTHPAPSRSELQRLRIAKLFDELTMHTWLARPAGLPTSTQLASAIPDSDLSIFDGMDKVIADLIICSTTLTLFPHSDGKALHDSPLLHRLKDFVTFLNHLTSTFKFRLKGEAARASSEYVSAIRLYGTKIANETLYPERPISF